MASVALHAMFVAIMYRVLISLPRDGQAAVSRYSGNLTTAVLIFSGLLMLMAVRRGVWSKGAR